MIDAPPIFPIISAISLPDTIPVNNKIPAPIDAGHASLMPPGLIKITSIAIMKTKVVIPMPKVMITPPLYLQKYKTSPTCPIHYILCMYNW
ncbi:hypothetical protein R50345_12115 [Paenibacillus sp. FSL R5-0345]|uniref:Uncharacterized protein n=1 Tax=Paenibacillus odorifer TaxID=189426 RepID=A0A1R0Y6T6_9BACL|nr:hypothetical protein R50345_12115 [Paenibacillus sp. FSL R5-0345]OMD43061.1 hypothetical protein BSK52_06060 [Paenibacillus odorifer]